MSDMFQQVEGQPDKAVMEWAGQKLHTHGSNRVSKHRFATTNPLYKIGHSGIDASLWYAVAHHDSTVLK